MVIKILAIIFPIILFIFKYSLPSMAESAYNNTKREKRQIKIELMHFPVDLLYVAISYTIPKIIETSSQLFQLIADSQSSIEHNNQLIASLMVYCTITGIMIMTLPFLVFFSKIIDKNYYKKKKRWIPQVVSAYFISIIFIIISLFV